MSEKVSPLTWMAFNLSILALAYSSSGLNYVNAYPEKEDPQAINHVSDIPVTPEVKQVAKQMEEKGLGSAKYWGQVIMIESGGDPTAYNPKGYYGYFQISTKLLPRGASVEEQIKFMEERNI
jgi:hypothetical protein